MSVNHSDVLSNVYQPDVLKSTMLIVINDFDPPGYTICRNIKWIFVVETLHRVTKLVRFSRFNLDSVFLNIRPRTAGWIASASSPSALYILRQGFVFPTPSRQIWEPQMADGDLRAPFRPQDLEQDYYTTVVSSVLGYLSNSGDKGSESYKSLVLVFPL